MASQYGSLEVVGALLDHNANVDAVTKVYIIIIIRRRIIIIIIIIRRRIINVIKRK